MCQYLTDFHGKSQRFEIFATISSKYLNSIVYYLSITYTSIITTESIVTIWMNRRNAFSGNSFTMRIPSKAPMPIAGSIRRFSENECQEMLSQAKTWKGTFSRLTTRTNQALMPTYSIFPLRIESR